MNNASSVCDAPASRSKATTVARHSQAQTGQTSSMRRKQTASPVNISSAASSPHPTPALHTAFLFQPDFVSSQFCSQANPTPWPNIKPSSTL
ncbi:MAG: hypothetical protein IPP19_07395 [Verrucomicrobia bacterium]|nr:hypothetical protein [Verrucomicrobiota bacterium]